MARISIDVFGGIRPRFARHHGDVARASVAENTKLWHGTIAPFRKPKEVHTANTCVNALMVYGCTVVTDVNACASFAYDPLMCGHIFATDLCGYDFPVVADFVTSSYISDVPEFEWRRLGVVAPSPVAFVVPALAPAVPAPSILRGQQLEREHRDYVITYVNSRGQESARSGASPDAGDADHSAVAVLTIPPRPDPAELWDIVAVRVYRLISGNVDGQLADENSEYMFAFEVDVTTVPWATPIVVSDTTPADRLAEAPPHVHAVPPPENLHGITVLTSGALVGYVGNELWFSEPFQPHSWPCLMRLDDCIKGIREADGSIYVATDGRPYVVSTNNKSEECLCCREVFMHPEPAPIASGMRGMVATNAGAMWPTNDGLARMSGRSLSVVSHSDVAEDNWPAFIPAVASHLNGRYYGFGGKSFSFDYTDGVYADGDVGANSRMYTISYNVNAAYSDKNGYMFVALGNKVYSWEASDEFETYTWRSKLNQAHSMINWSAARVFFGSGGKSGYSEPVTFRLLDGAGVPLFTRQVFDERPFRLPPNIKHRAFEVEFSGTSEIHGFVMATSMRELAPGYANGE